MVTLMRNSVDEIEFYEIASGMIYASAINDEVAAFRLAHSHRVAELTGKLSVNVEIDKTILYKIALIHDAYKYLNRENHGLMAAKFVESILIGFEIRDKELIEWRKAIQALEKHSEVPKDNANMYHCILFEADKLDKLHPSYIRDLANHINMNGNYSEAAIKALIKTSKISGYSPNFDKIRRGMQRKAAIKFCSKAELESLSIYNINLE